MTTTTRHVWGLPFDPQDLVDALAFAAEKGLPLSLCLEHEADEVLEVPPRDGAGLLPVQFTIYRPACGSAPFVVAENDRLRARAFEDLKEALQFCLDQRGAEWPADSNDNDNGDD